MKRRGTAPESELKVNRLEATICQHLFQSPRLTTVFEAASFSPKERHSLSRIGGGTPGSSDMAIPRCEVCGDELAFLLQLTCLQDYLERRLEEPEVVQVHICRRPTCSRQTRSFNGDIYESCSVRTVRVSRLSGLAGDGPWAPRALVCTVQADYPLTLEVAEKHWKEPAYLRVWREKLDSVSELYGYNLDNVDKLKMFGFSRGPEVEPECPACGRPLSFWILIDPPTVRREQFDEGRDPFSSIRFFWQYLQVWRCTVCSGDPIVTAHFA